MDVPPIQESAAKINDDPESKPEEEKKEIDANEVQMEEIKYDHRNPTESIDMAKCKQADASPKEAEEDLDKFSSSNFVSISVSQFQKSTLWFSLVTAFLAMRGANTFSVLLAYVSVLLRIFQAISIVT